MHTASRCLSGRRLSACSKRRRNSERRTCSSVPSLESLNHHAPVRAAPPHAHGSAAPGTGQSPAASPKSPARRQDGHALDGSHPNAATPLKTPRLQHPPPPLDCAAPGAPAKTKAPRTVPHNSPMARCSPAFNLWSTLSSDSSAATCAVYTPRRSGPPPQRSPSPTTLPAEVSPFPKATPTTRHRFAFFHRSPPKAPSNGDAASFEIE
jgi:hypothetical protein